MSNRAMVVNGLSANLNSTKKEADRLYLTVIEEIKYVLMDQGEVVLPGFGRLKLEHKPARRGHNPRTRELIDIPAKTVIKFKSFPSFEMA